MKTTAAASALVAAPAFPTAVFTRRAKTRYANVGVGSRSRMYQNAVLNTYKDHAEMVGYCDVNEGRLRYAQNNAREWAGVEVPTFHADEFDEMVARTNPDTVIVTTVDGTHHEYIIRAMELGCDVITEKPMTIDAAKCQAIVDTQRRTGKTCRVTFNYRYSPPRTQVKDILMSGEIGDLLSVDFVWLLNTHHGADYFRRWHSQKELSGGLMVHKATHHFDLMNWWLSAIPETVSARGSLDFYTPEMAVRLGLDSYHQRCHTCPEAAKCGFELDMSENPGLKALYLDNEQYDGYFRDRCVFRPDINIEDKMSVVVTYDNDVQLSYQLNAFNAWEGYIINFNGTKGRLEHRIEEQVYVSGTDTVQGGIREGGTVTRVVPLRGAARDIEPWSGEGGHGGGDQVMLDDIFLPDTPDDKYKRAADHRAGAYSILTGVAANHSIADPGEVVVADLVTGIGYPDYAVMPSPVAPLPMPEKRERRGRSRPQPQGGNDD